jgi:hypothetical protein
MSERQNEPQSSLRVFRKVIVTPQSERFINKVTNKAAEFFKFKATLVYNEETLEQQLAPGHGRSVRPVKIAALQVYPDADLELTLFERHAPVSEGMGRLYDRAKVRVSAPSYQSRVKQRSTTEHRIFQNPMFAQLQAAAKEFGITDLNELSVGVSSLVKLSDDRQDGKGDEYGLVLNPELRETAYINREAEVVYGAIRRLAIGKKIVGGIDPASAVLPLLRTPADADPWVVKEFIECIETDYLKKAELTFGVQAWQANEPIDLAR